MKLKSFPTEQSFLNVSFTLKSTLLSPINAWPFLSDLVFQCCRNYRLAASRASVFSSDPFYQTLLMKYVFAIWNDSQLIFFQIHTADRTLTFCFNFFSYLLQHFLTYFKIIALSNLQNLGQLIYGHSHMVLINFFWIFVLFQRLFLVWLELLRTIEPSLDLTKIIVALRTQNKILSGFEVREKLDLAEMTPILRTVKLWFFDFHKKPFV
jgi:hypothetical protein